VFLSNKGSGKRVQLKTCPLDQKQRPKFWDGRNAHFPTNLRGSLTLKEQYALRRWGTFATKLTGGALLIIKIFTTLTEKPHGLLSSGKGTLISQT
jgi:hypothetical protein